MRLIVVRLIVVYHVVSGNKSHYVYSCSLPESYKWMHLPGR